MKKNYLLLAVTAIMMSVGAYSLVDTKEASVLMSLKEVEALADQESDGGEVVIVRIISLWIVVRNGNSIIRIRKELVIIVVSAGFKRLRLCA